jgi:hypothetical protein
MPRIDLVVESDVVRTPRVAQLEGMFDAPLESKTRLTWRGSIPIEQNDWNVGLIVGPSGAGKSLVARELFGDLVDVPLSWGTGAVVDDFDPALGMGDIASVCQAVGFNTIPAWARPYAVLSNGEKFRVEMARRLVEQGDLIVMDEFTSVVDRQVAKIGAHAVAKYVRRHQKQFVGVSCHYDIVDWLQPDWLFEPATMTFTRRECLQRPKLDVEIIRVHRKAWELFAPYHYMTGTLQHAAKCYLLLVDGVPASFAGILHRYMGKERLAGAPIKGVSRVVTLPDWQGLGLAMVLLDTLGAAYTAVGFRFHVYPAHPGFVRTFQRSPRWKQKKQAGTFSGLVKRPQRGVAKQTAFGGTNQGGRPCGVFEYVGPKMPKIQAYALTGENS